MKILLAAEGSEFSKAAVGKCCQIFGGSDGSEIRIISAAEPVIVRQAVCQLSEIVRKPGVQTDCCKMEALFSTGGRRK